MGATKNMMLVGVGGQGTLLASRILGNLFLAEGFDVKVSEVHGMSQRGGSVVTYLRWGQAVHSPVVEMGEAQWIVAFELLEAARWLPYLSIGGKLLVNPQTISPMPVITGAMQYPTDLVEKLSATGCALTVVDALTLATQAGSAKAVNVVMLGALSHQLPFSLESWQAALEKTLPEKLLSLNQKAFALGRQAVNL